MAVCQQCKNLAVHLERAKSALQRDARRLAATQDGTSTGHSQLSHLRTNVEKSKALRAGAVTELERHQKTCPHVSVAI
jgi:hypothetical protein